MKRRRLDQHDFRLAQYRQHDGQGARRGSAFSRLFTELTAAALWPRCDDSTTVFQLRPRGRCLYTCRWSLISIAHTVISLHGCNKQLLQDRRSARSGSPVVGSRHRLEILPRSWMSEGFAHFSAAMFAQVVYKRSLCQFWKEQREAITNKNQVGKRPSDIGSVYMGVPADTPKTGPVGAR